MQRASALIKAHIIHRPAIDCDGCNPFRRFCGGFAQTFIETRKYRLDGPEERGAALNRPILDAMDFCDFRVAIEPAEQRYATTLCAEIDRNPCDGDRLWLVPDRHSPQKGLGEAAIDGKDMTGGAARFGAGQEQNRLCAIRRIDGLMRQRALGVERGEQCAQFVIRF